jgi:hypothetical protein
MVITFGMSDGTDAAHPEQQRRQLAAPAMDAARASNLNQSTLYSETYAFNTGIQFAPARN